MAEGLFDFFKTPEGQGVLGGLFGLAANAQRGAPINALGRGGLTGLMAFGQATDRQDRTQQEAQEREIRAMQLRQMRDAATDQQLARDTASKFFTPGAPSAGGMLEGSLPPEMQTGAVPVPAVAPKFDMRGYAQARMAQNPLEGIKLMTQLQKETPINKLDVKDFTPASVQKFNQTGNYADLERMDKLHFADTGGGIVGLNSYTGAPVGSPVRKTGNPYSDLVVSDGNGGVMPNTPLVNVKRDIAKSGATNLSVNTDKSYFGNVAEGLAKNDVALIDAARSAPDRVASARRVKEILQKNPITGTGAEARLAFNKAFATAGLIDGKTVADTETLASNLANQTLDAIKTSGLGSGQGFTDKDRQFLERAKSGNIEMNAETLRRLADLNEQSALASIRRGNSVISKLKTSPQAGAMGAQLDPIEEPAATAAAGQSFAKMPTANPGNKGRFLTDQQTGKRYQSNGMQWVEVK